VELNQIEKKSQEDDSGDKDQEADEDLLSA